MKGLVYTLTDKQKIPQVKPKKKFGGGRIRGKEIEKKEKEKKKTKRKCKEGKEEKNEGDCMIRERGGKNGTAFPFAISGEPAFETSQGKRQSWSTRRELHIGTKKCRFRPVPKGRGFSYTGYFLPSCHVRAILVQH